MNGAIRLIAVAAVIAASAPAQPPASAPADQPTLILGAIKIETAPIERQLADKHTEKVRGVKFITGSLAGRPVVLARTGAGKVNAAMVATLAIEHFSPREVIFSGTSGGIGRVSVGDVVIAAKTAQHDFGIITGTGFEPQLTADKETGAKAPIFYPADAALLAAAQSAAETVELPVVETAAGPRQPVIVTGVVVTGDVFIASSDKKGDLRETFGALAVEMEGAAVAAVCQKLKVPCLVIRSVSDSADEQAVQDFDSQAKAAAENAAAVTVATVTELAATRDVSAAAPATTSPAPAR